MAPPGRSEDTYGEKVDRCLYNSLIKFVGGVGVGIVCSVLLFKRKPWPMILGAGIGGGMGIADCNHEFKGAKVKALNDSVPLQYVNANATVQVTSPKSGYEKPLKGQNFTKPSFTEESTALSEFNHATQIDEGSEQ